MAPRAILPVLLGALFGIAGLGTTALSAVLVDAGEDLQVASADTTWFISLYVLMMAVSTPLYGRLLDVFGPRVPLVLGVAMMTAGALAAALAQGFVVMLCARLLQGFGAGAGATLAVAIVGASLTGKDRVRGLSVVAGVAASIGVAGPLIGGLVEHALGWRMVAALPATCVILLALLWCLLDDGRGVARSFDLPGALFVSMISGGLVMMIQSPSTTGVLTVAGIACVGVGVPLLVLRSRSVPDPFVPPTIVRNGRLVAVCLIAGTIPAAWFALLVAVPVWLAALGWSALQVGLLLAPPVVVAAVAPRITTRLIAHIGPDRSLAVAAILGCVAVGSAAWGVSVGAVPLMPVAITLASVGFSLAQPALFSLVGDMVSVEIRGTASGLATLVFLCCGSAGSAVIGGLQPLWDFTGSMTALTAVLALGALAAVLRAGGKVEPDAS